jgi:dopamine beta-monooxygenase
MRALLAVSALLCHAVLAYPAYLPNVPNAANIYRNGVLWNAGHVAQTGTGVRNNFGWAFAGAGHVWTTQLCQADSDGDGFTNGVELGDPSCIWTVGAVPSRTGDISHPGFADSTPTTATAVPATPTVMMQYNTQYALGQMTTVRQTTLGTATAALLGVSVGSVTLSAFLTTLGATALRFAITTPSSSNVTFAALNASLSNTSSAYHNVTQPVPSSLSVVPDCGAVCTVTATSATARNADNTACSCACRNQFSDATCGSCLAPFTGTRCDRCATGYVGYPSCVTPSSCAAPSTAAYVEEISAACVAKASANITNCLKSSCDCQTGAFTATTGSCAVPSTTTACVRHVCGGALRECIATAKQTAFAAHTGECAADATAHAAGQSSVRAWCTFNACIDARGALADCTTAQVTQGCSAVTTASGAAALVKPATAFLLVALALL